MFPLCYIFPQGIMNPDQGKNVGKQIDAEHYNTKYTGIGKLIEVLSFFLKICRLGNKKG